jgi:hypothetical protein
LVLGGILAISLACGDDENPLAPYEGQPAMSNIVVEGGTLTPKITWLGGYVTVLGINRGAAATLDSSLVWLIHAGGNSIHYPVTFGELPPGAQDLTSQYGGNSLDRLVEDETYTCWVLKEDVWNQVSATVNKPLRVDQSLTAAAVEIHNDTVFVNSRSHTQSLRTIDLFVNVKDVKIFGRLGSIEVQQSATSNNPVVTWKITQIGVTDSLISAMGVVNAQQYQAAGNLWEVWSEESVGGQSVLGKKNVIRGPVVLGQLFSETRVFVDYPAEGLQRDKDYYVWIANKDWDGQGRLRATPNYAFATFHTW